MVVNFLIYLSINVCYIVIKQCIHDTSGQRYNNRCLTELLLEIILPNSGYLSIDEKIVCIMYTCTFINFTYISMVSNT